MIEKEKMLNVPWVQREIVETNISILYIRNVLSSKEAIYANDNLIQYF